MKKTMNFAIVAATMFFPAIALAAVTAQPYDKFELTKAETKTVANRTAANCPKKAGGPKYQAKCRQKLMGKSEARLNIRYELALARLSAPAKTQLQESQGFWIHERYNECVYLSEDIETNPRPEAAVEIEYNDCALVELKRRTLWLDRYK
jgi:uncharacterized protein YecT (DUF1311 family)